MFTKSVQLSEKTSEVARDLVYAIDDLEYLILETSTDVDAEAYPRREAVADIKRLSKSMQKSIATLRTKLISLENSVWSDVDKVTKRVKVLEKAIAKGKTNTKTKKSVAQKPKAPRLSGRAITPPFFDE